MYQSIKGGVSAVYRLTRRDQQFNRAPLMKSISIRLKDLLLLLTKCIVQRMLVFVRGVLWDLHFFYSTLGYQNSQFRGGGFAAAECHFDTTGE